jgi:hypothetical protein
VDGSVFEEVLPSPGKRIHQHAFTLNAVPDVSTAFTSIESEFFHSATGGTWNRIALNQ